MTNEQLKNEIIEVMDFPKKGISFKDISGILSNPEAIRFITDEFAKVAKDADVIVGADARGFLFGPLLSTKLNIPFVMARKAGKLPGEVEQIEYALEYGTDKIEIKKGSISKGDKVVIIDDLLATGGTAKAIQDLVTRIGGEVVKSLFVIELTFIDGAKKLGEEKVFSLVKY